MPTRFVPIAYPVWAVQWTGKNLDEVRNFASIPGQTEYVESLDATTLRVRTETGVVLAQVGDYIWRDADFHFRVSARQIFETTYEPAPIPSNSTGLEAPAAVRPSVE